MGKDIATKYHVKFVNNYEDFDEPLEINFTATDSKDVKEIVSALSSHYSGDPCECFIDGHKALLENDWGLIKPEVAA